MGVAIGCLLGYVVVGLLLGDSDEDRAQATSTTTVVTPTTGGFADLDALPPPPADTEPAVGAGSLAETCRNADLQRVIDVTNDLAVTAQRLSVSLAPTEDAAREVIDKAVVALEVRAAVLAPIMDAIAAESELPGVQSAARNTADTLRAQAAEAAAIRSDPSASLVEIGTRFEALEQASPMAAADAQLAFAGLALEPDCEGVVVDLVELAQQTQGFPR